MLACLVLHCLNFPTPSPQKTSLARDCCNIPISNNVGGVTQFSRTLLYPLQEERHFALVDAIATWAISRVQEIFISSLGISRGGC